MGTLDDTSVVIPARNAAVTIGGCLDSIARLDPGPLEVIVVDDASTDETAHIAKGRGARVISLSRNVGPGLARNAGVRAARSAYVAFTDADCQVPSDWLDSFHSTFDPERYSGITGPYAGSSAQTLLCALMDSALKYAQRGLPDAIDSSISSNLFVRVADFLEVGGFPAYRLPGAAMCSFGNEDEELAHLLAKHTQKPLKWLRTNGVYHAFRPTWRAYFRQQAKYAEAILVSYARFPAMLFGTTNYSRSGGAGKIVAVWLLLLSSATSVALRRPLLLAGSVPFLALNLGAVLHSVRQEASPARRLSVAAAAYPFQAVTALAWTKGLFVGACKALLGSLSPIFWTRQEGEVR